MDTTNRKLDEVFLERFLNAPSPSGYEQPAQRLFREFVKPYVSDIKTDVIGNVITTVNPTGSPKIMLMGHADEVGMMVRYISKEGFIYFHSLGGLDAHLLPGCHVLIMTREDKIRGIIGKKAIHLQEAKERTQVIELKDQYIDIGARSREEVEKLGIYIGDPIIFDFYYQRLGNNDDITSRCFDDKIGAFIVAEIIKRLKDEKIPGCIFGVSSVQEEVGLRGATVSSYGINPQIGIAFDVDFTTDTPGLDEKNPGIAKLGGGPILSRGPNMNPILFNLIFETAKELNIPVQVIAEPRGTGTDANVIQTTRSGIVTGLIGIPNRYMHSYSEVLNLQDVENIIVLTIAVLKKITPEMSFIPTI